MGFADGIFLMPFPLIGMAAAILANAELECMSNVYPLSQSISLKNGPFSAIALGIDR